MRFLSRLYQYINILSIDVVAGSVIGALFFARIFELPVSIEALAALALTVWVVYTTDHLRDALFIPEVASSDRHRYHQKHFLPIAFALLLVLIADLALVLVLQPPVLLYGAALTVPVLLYLMLQRRLKFLKEFFVAVLYTAGLLVPSLAAGIEGLTLMQLVVIGKYFLTAWMNLLLFSLIDYHEDRLQRQHSFVTRFGPVSTRYSILFLGGANILSGMWLWSQGSTAAVIFILMNALLLLILFFQRQFAVNNYYRIAGDAVFFIPLVYLA